MNGGRKLVDLSAHSTYGASIFFVSTISTVMKWPVNHTGKMPEAVIDDWSLPQPMGYAESKYVSERLLEEASRVSDVLGKICRVRQVAGPTSQMGHWIMREWFPGLIASSAFMGVIPENLGPMEMVDWVPVDLLSKIILDLFLRQEVQGQHDNVASHAGESTPLDESCEESKTNSAVNSSAETTASNHNQGVTVASTNGTTNHTILQTISATTTVYHAIDPHQTTYSSLLPTILSHLPPQATPIGLDEWVRKLEHSEQDLEHNPASKLLDFFKALVEMACQGLKMVVLDIEGTVRESATLRGMGEVEAGWMGNWMRGWGWGWGY